LTSVEAQINAPDQDLLALDKALTQLETLDARAARIIELRFFGGLNEQEIAETLGLSRKTVERDWKTARAWLVAQLIGPEKRTGASA
jgi:RNA polymerase sigma factor (sigma-70 family)